MAKRNLVWAVLALVCAWAEAAPVPLQQSFAPRGERVYLRPEAGSAAGQPIWVGSQRATLERDDTGIYFVVPIEAALGPQTVTSPDPPGQDDRTTSLDVLEAGDIAVLGLSRVEAGSPEPFQAQFYRELEGLGARRDLPAPTVEAARQLLNIRNLQFVPAPPAPVFVPPLRPGLQLPPRVPSVLLRSGLGRLTVPDLRQLPVYPLSAVRGTQRLSAVGGAGVGLLARRSGETPLPGLEAGDPLSREMQLCGKTITRVEGQYIASGVVEAINQADTLILDPTTLTRPSLLRSPAQAPRLPTAAERWARMEEALLHTGAFQAGGNGQGRQRSVTQRGQGTQVYVIDTGAPTVGREVREFEDGYEHESKYVFLETEGPEGESVYPTVGHGAVIGLLLFHERQGIVPLAEPHYVQACVGTSCLLERVLDGLCQAAQAARSGPVVVNLSLHARHNSPLLKLALTDALTAGAWVVSSYGNDDDCAQNPLDTCAAYPADWQTEDGSFPRLVSVAGWSFTAGGTPFNRASSYNRGARGSRVPTQPTVFAQGNFWVQYRRPISMPYGGTSFAAPVVTGALAAWLGEGCQRRGTVPDLHAGQQDRTFRVDIFLRANCQP